MPGVDVARAAGALSDRIRARPEILLVLGSGQSSVADVVEVEATVRFEELPGLPAADVSGHAGRFLTGRLEGRPVLVQAGRFHFYEGWPPDVVVAPVRIAAKLGVATVVLTNAAGGIGRGLEPGSVMLLDDHLNLQLRTPLAGPARDGEARFPDMSAPYDPLLAEAALEVAEAEGIRLLRGTYAAVTGPSYETPAEIRMLARLGADAVGMSTVPTVLVARALGLSVLALSTITNRAAGLARGSLSHEEVLEVGRRASGTVETLIRGVVADLPP